MATSTRVPTPPSSRTSCCGRRTYDDDGPLVDDRARRPRRARERRPHLPDLSTTSITDSPIVSQPDLGDGGRVTRRPGARRVHLRSLDDLVTTYERLRDLGIQPILPINHGMTLSLYYADPDGNQAELQIDLLRHRRRRRPSWQSEEFAANPLGVTFDPEEMAAPAPGRRSRSTALGVYGPSSMNMDADVVVVGCGPVGVMTSAAVRTARTLGDRGRPLRPRSSRFPAPSAWTRRSSACSRTRAFSRTLRARSRRPCSAPSSSTRDGTRLVGIDLPEGTIGPNGHPPMAMFDQPGLERAPCVRQLLRQGSRSSSGSMPPSLDAGDARGGGARDAAAPTVEATRVAASRWLVGADGASSTIRNSAGIPFVDQGFDQEWLVVIDTTVLDPACEMPQVAQQVCDPDRVISYRTRPRNPPPLGDPPQPGRDGASEMLDASTHLPSCCGAVGRLPGQLRIDRPAVYRFHALVAETFRAGSGVPRGRRRATRCPRSTARAWTLGSATRRT